MKSLLVVLLLSTLSFGVNIDSSFLKDDKDFRVVFDKFWGAYGDKNATKMYGLESPHFRYLYSFEDYKAYADIIILPKSVTLLDRRSESENVYIVGVKLDYEDGASARISEYWIRVDGRLYHHSNVFLLFQE